MGTSLRRLVFNKPSGSMVGTPNDPKEVAELPETLHNNFRGWAMRKHAALCNLYSSCAFIAIVACVVALATPGWYTSHDTGLVRSSSDPSGILRSADYAFTIFGLSIDVSYCVAEGPSQGECTNAVDQFRFFDDSKNSEGIKWSRVANGHFADDTRDCDTSSTLLFRGSII